MVPNCNNYCGVILDICTVCYNTYVVALKTAQCNVTVRVRVRVVRARGRGWDFFPFFCLC